MKFKLFLVSLMMPFQVHAANEWICDGYADQSVKDRCFKAIQGSSDCTMAYIYAIKDCNTAARDAHKKNDDLARDIYTNKSAGQHKVNQAASNATNYLAEAAPLYRQAGNTCKAKLSDCDSKCSDDGDRAECRSLVSERVKEIFELADTSDGRIKESKKTYNTSSADIASAQTVAPKISALRSPPASKPTVARPELSVAAYWGMHAAASAVAPASSFEP